MTNPVLRRTLAFSLIGHLTVLSLFGFSFGPPIPKADYASVSFWGQCLRNAQVSPPLVSGLQIRKFLKREPDTRALGKVTKAPVAVDYYAKPLCSAVFKSEKETFIASSAALLFIPKRPEPAIIFHPLLPYSFTLYFKDRQVAHVELMYKLTPEGRQNAISVKRKISSGNLEADLLVMRYINHYLFIQQARFIPDKWQTVKIDLSAKE